MIPSLPGRQVAEYGLTAALLSVAKTGCLKSYVQLGLPELLQSFLTAPGNASPAGDLLPPLLVLDAVLTLTSREGVRQVPLSKFLLGPGKTDLSKGEIIYEISFKKPDPETRSSFIKFGNRQGMAISVVNTAVLLKVDPTEKVEDIRIALGAVAPTPIRCRRAENVLLGKKVTAALIEKTAAAAAEESSPISDVRASADFRRHAAKVLVQRCLRNCLS